MDSAGNVYVADQKNDTIRKITPSGVVTTLAGTAGQAGAADGTGSAAEFNLPQSLAIDSLGNVYVADSSNDTIREITPGGDVTTLAGSAGNAGSVDGTGAAARFDYPTGVAVDREGNVYVADTSNETIRKITPGGVVTTLAGLTGFYGSADGTGSAARFRAPEGIAVDGSGNVYVADAVNNVIRTITPAGVVATLAGTAPYAGDADGTGGAASFWSPRGVALDSAGDVYVADTQNSRIRRITPAGVVTTLPAGLQSSGSTNGMGSTARFASPFGIAVDSAGNVFVGENGNETIRKILPSGEVSTLAGTPENPGSADGTGSAAAFHHICGVAVDSGDNVYVADSFNDTIRKVTPAGVVTTLAGSAQQSGYVDSTGAAARFSNPQGVAVDSAGNVYVADTGNFAIRRITPAGAVNTLAGGSWGSADGTGSAAQFKGPVGIALDKEGNVYVTDNYVLYAGEFPTDNTYRIRKVTPAGAVTTLAGVPNNTGSADGPGASALFNDPQGLAVDGAGNIYVVDTNNNTVRMVSPSGVVTTLAGVPGSAGCADGSGATAQFSAPSGVAVDGSGNLYVADTGNNTIRIGISGNSGLSILNQTQSQIVLAGATATFSVIVDASPPPAYQWQVSADGGVTWTDISDGGGITGSATGTLDVVAGDGLNGVEYECVITNSAGSETTVPALLTVDAVPAITAQPASEAVGVGSVAILTVSASGSPAPTFQWEESTNGGVSFSSLSDGGGISGSSTATLNVVASTVALNGTEYECVVSNSQGSVTTAPATLNVTAEVVIPPPSISTQPVSQTVNAGSGVILSVVASGSSALSYQWYFNGSPAAGATGATLSFSNVTAANGGAYSVVVTDSSGNRTTSDSVTLTVSTVAGSAIATQPMSQTIATGSTVVFTVGANGSVQSSLAVPAGETAKLSSGTTYQWQFNGANLTDGSGISGSAGPQLVIQGAGVANTGDYACIVTTGGVASTSNSASLLVGSVSSPGYLINLSARGFVGTGNGVLIGGFYIVGSTSRTVLVQALGPALSGEGVSGVLQHPALTIHNATGATIYSNTGWGSSQLLLNAAAAAYANPVLLANSGDSEVLLTLPPGGYTAEISGADGGTGVALCAMYQLP
jgi:sugar lactone lactonase YvrE